VRRVLDTYVYVGVRQEPRNNGQLGLVGSHMRTWVQQVQQAPQTLKVPTTRAELEALGAQRGELQSQLKGLEERRESLSDQMARTKTVGSGVMERLEVIDHRSTELERQIARLDEAIAAGLARPGLVQDVPSEITRKVVTNVPGFEGTITVPGPHVIANAVDVAVATSVWGLSMVLIGVIAWRYAVRRLTRIVGGTSEANIARLQQSVDAIAIEVERISENQRFVTKSLNEHLPMLNVGRAEPIQVGQVPEHQPARRG
jgi:hypothetical protein